MEKLPFMIHGMSITDQAAKDNVGPKHRLRPVAMEEVDGCFRLRNAKDLLRYGLYRPPLGDRIRILAAMDEMGSLTIAECLSAVVEGRPMPTVAALVLQGFLEVDLDSDMIRPDTQVRRIRG